MKAIGAGDEMFLSLDIAAAIQAFSARRRSPAADDSSRRRMRKSSRSPTAKPANAVTIVTGDRIDIQLLVDLTRRPNIAVALV